MRCPKCGYNSFDHLDSCKKCGKDLVEHKQKFGIVSVLFPGQMSPTGATAETDSDIAVEEVAAVAATAATSAAVSESVAEDAGADFDEPVATESGEGDDFGFDFMGDSEEEEDLSFDELFEEAPADEDVEETLPSPDQETAKEDDEDLAFEPAAEEAAAESDLESDFGFDPDDASEDLEADDFELPDDDSNEFSFETDDVDLEEEAEGAEEDPKDPFDFPESSQDEEAPEAEQELFSIETETDSSELEESDLSLADSFFTEDEPIEEALQAEEAAVFVENVQERLIEEEETEVSPFDAALEEETSPTAVCFEEEIQPESVTSTDIADAEVAEPLATEQAIEESPPESSAEEPVAEDISSFESETPIDQENVIGSAERCPAVEGADLEPAEEELEPEAVELLPQTGSRVAAFCCDLLLLLIVGTCFVVAAEAAMSPADDSLIPSMETLIDLSVPYFLVLFSLAFGYFTLFHFLAGQTPGKMLAGLRVETIEGEPLLFSQAFLRSVGGLLQVLPAGLGYLVILLSPDRRGWNDQLAGTRLISLKGLTEEL